MCFTRDDFTHRTFLIPEGSAQGFQTLSDNCEMLYLHTAAHNAEAEGRVSADDARVAINWPLPIGEMSDRDRPLPALDEGFAAW